MLGDMNTTVSVSYLTSSWVIAHQILDSELRMSQGSILGIV